MQIKRTRKRGGKQLEIAPPNNGRLTFVMSAISSELRKNLKNYKYLKNKSKDEVEDEEEESGNDVVA